MSILNKLMDTMRLTENDDDYFDEEDYEEEKPVIKKRSFGKRDEEMDDYRHEEESKPRFLPRSSNNKVVQMRRSMEVSLIKPTSMEDTREICDYLLAGKAVVLNMEGIHMEVAQRIIDFTCGATYSMDGNLQKISNYIFIATPSSVERLSRTLSRRFHECFRDESPLLILIYSQVRYISEPGSIYYTIGNLCDF